ncbi:MAG: hypothetical protein LBU88_01725 [Treponema sp.]|jgi:hypothetical protein|nr:hypothetical protein [Treponema sp.]
MSERQAKRGRQFKTVKRPRVPRNKFNLSHEKRLSAEMFFLYPILLDDCIAGDFWQIANSMVLRMNPVMCPLMHEINIFTHYYFVPYRLLWEQWENFFTGGQDGKFVADMPRIDPSWFTGNIDDYFRSGSLWDYFGFNTISGSQTYHDIVKMPLAFPLYAYNLIWNEYYRDPNIMDEVGLRDMRSPDEGIEVDGTLVGAGKNAGLRVRCWEKDYFTSMLPWQQRGEPVSIGLHGDTFADFYDSVFSLPPHSEQLETTSAVDVAQRVSFGTSEVSYGFRAGGPTYLPESIGTLRGALNKNQVSLDNVSTFDVSELRFLFQLQRFMERSARTGSRYVEFLKGQFNANPRDDRLQRPEYIGGSKTPLVISEVLQTSSSDQVSPQGNMAGHGISADSNYISSYRVQEPGLIMGLMSIMPRTMYQQGIDRVWLKDSKYDHYFPVFANLSEQAVYFEELYNFAPDLVDRVIGYQGRYDEYRFKRNTVHGMFRDEFEYWQLARKFSSAPTLNADLVAPNEAERFAMKRPLASHVDPMFLISFGNKCHVTRPMPFMAEPGLIDHN